MSLALSAIFLVFGAVAIGIGAVIAVYLVIGLFVVQDLRKSDSKHEAIQRQIRFLNEDAIISSDLVLKNAASLDSTCEVHSEGLHLAVKGARQEPKAIGS